jgi:hypothetical protein
MANIDYTRILQKTANELLYLFDNMEPVLVVCMDNPKFKEQPECGAFYSYAKKTIYFNPEFVKEADFQTEVVPSIKHELIHAWLHRKGIDQMGKEFAPGHNEWFVRKAVELGLDVLYLIKTPEAMHLYNEIAGIWTPPHKRGESTAWPDVSKGTKDAKDTTEKALLTDKWLDGFDKVHNDYERRLNEVEKGSLEWHLIQATWKYWQEHHDPEDPGAYNPFIKFDSKAFDTVYWDYVKRLKAVPEGSPEWQQINAEMNDWLIHFPVDNPAGYKPKLRAE